jgi:hypothetical protein
MVSEYRVPRSIILQTEPRWMPSKRAASVTVRTASSDTSKSIRLLVRTRLYSVAASFIRPRLDEERTRDTFADITARF